MTDLTAADHDAGAARAHKSLAHPRRMRIFRLLAEAPELGKNVQTLQLATGIPEASFLHHLREMQGAGLVVKRRAGAEVRVYLDPARLAWALRHTGQILTRRRATVRAAA